MNKTAIRKFAEWARERLIDDIKYKAGTVGITENGIAEKLPQSTSDTQFYDVGTKDYTKISGVEIKQRDALVKAIQTKESSYKSYQEAFENVIEEVAYTWFNRLIAIRFMEVNDYLPSGVRVLSSENKAKKEPDLVTTPFDTDLEFTSYEQDRIIQLKDDNKLDELFRMLFIKQCNKLHDILPELFEKTDDYSELLLTISFTDPEGIIHHLINDIEDVDFRINDEMYTDDGKIKADGQVEIIGWLYQYYISKKHDEIVNIYKGTVKKADIPAATQLFTTDWVVRYMVDNSLGRYWIERNPESNLAEKLEFFVKPKDGHINYVNEKVEPTELTFFDPCMGSGHILVYAFDVLMEIYRECGYTDRDAAKSIIENNLYGLDIDKRAYQLAYFAVMMKARSYNRRILSRGVISNLTYIEESNNIDRFACGSLTTDKNQNKIGEYLVDVYKHAQEYGSLQSVATKDYESFREYLDSLDNGELDIFASAWLNTVRPLMYQLVKQAEIMSKRYAVVCTNPPYMNKFEGHLKDFIQENFKDYKGDLFSAFMFRNFGYCKQDGYSAFMTPFVWMFIKTYEQLREYIISQKAITSLIQMEYSAFEEATVPICSFVLKNGKSTEKALCFRLSDFKGGMQVQKEKVLEALEQTECSYFYEAQQDDFAKIPGSPIAYWASESLIDDFKNGTSIGNVLDVRQGLATADNDRFIRLWFEVASDKCKFDSACEDDLVASEKKWVPYNKGGQRRQWYGNYDYLVNWENRGFEIKNFKDKNGKLRSRPQNTDTYFKEAITWGLITSGGFSIRYRNSGGIHDVSGMSAFTNDKKQLKYILGILSTPIANYIFKMLNPTINLQVGDFKNFPLLYNECASEKVVEITNDCINIAKKDWDSFETSWNFLRYPMVLSSRDRKEQEQSQFATSRMGKYGSLLWQYEKYKTECEDRFQTLKSNEEELNRIFIDIYGLQDELTPEVEDKDVTVYRIFDSKEEIPESMGSSKYSLTRQDVVKDLISYAVGCMFGRYSLDVDGLAYAGGEWDNSKYDTFIPDEDNCIPITDEEYFEDDIVGLFCAWLKKVYGEDTLEENLDFIANALGNKGKTSREVIRNYFLTDFIKDHIKTYQKRPIYWLFDSGKQNGFKALVYMHRWNGDTIGNVRVEYLHRIQRVYEKEITRMQEIIDNSHDNKEISNATKRKEKLQKQIKETKDYDAKIAHLALSRIDIDLDDGVKINYEKVQTADGKKMQILAKI